MKQSKMPDASAQRYGKALAFAAEKHAGQKRKGTRIPYISHPMAVASLVLEHGGDEDEVIAALLHDVAEDCGGQEALDEIRERFGMGVAAIVRGCSDTLEKPKPKWRPRKEAFIEFVQGAPASVRLVAAADKLHNALSILRDQRTLGDKSLGAIQRVEGRGALVLRRGHAGALGAGDEPAHRGSRAGGRKDGAGAAR